MIVDLREGDRYTSKDWNEMNRNRAAYSTSTLEIETHGNKVTRKTTTT